jgi:hypothetical protein
MSTYWLFIAIGASTQHNASEAADNHKKIIALMHVLGNQHNQKTGYGHKHHTSVPLG